MEKPSWEVERMKWTFFRSTIRSSMGLEKYVSISSAERPGIMETMPTMGLSTYGIIRWGIWKNRASSDSTATAT